MFVIQPSGILASSSFCAVVAGTVLHLPFLSLLDSLPLWHFTCLKQAQAVFFCIFLTLLWHVGLSSYLSIIHMVSFTHFSVWLPVLSVLSQHLYIL